MNKELKALEEIRELFTCHDDGLLEKCSIIETALKEYDLLKRSLNRNWGEVVNDDKKLKALEIIKKYTDKDGVHIDFNKAMKATVKNFDYTTMTYIVDEELIKEYDLLKEVLL